MDKAEQEAAHLYRHHFGRMVASLLQYSRSIDPATAEDIVQDSFSEALTHWKAKGIPANPTGWIFQVCRNKALNKIRKDKHLTFVASDNGAGVTDVNFDESAVGDYQLKLLFACANPALAPKVQVVITLKYVVNLRIEAIAKVLGMTVDGVDKLLSRARQKIKEERIPLDEPPLSHLKSRVPVVHKVIYLIFNEGYKSSGSKEIIRRELCEEALLMNRALLESGAGNQDSAALHALMLFNGARFDSRFTPGGGLIELENQDRSKWNKDLISLGQEFLKRSEVWSTEYLQNISSYHLEASIACVHCLAADFNSTNWALIVKLYAKLLAGNPNPFVEMNYAIALFYTGEKTRAFGILNELRRHPYLDQYCLLNFTLGKLYHLDHQDKPAIVFLKKAHALAETEAEQDLIGTRLRAIVDR